MKQQQIRPLRWIAALALLWVTQAQAMEPVAGCEDAVQFNGSAITVGNADGDDTANLQCALEAARDLSVPTVQLNSGDYTVGSIIVDDFEGELRGRANMSTTLLLAENTIDCIGMRAMGLSAAGLKFVDGSPTLRYLNIDDDYSCGVPAPFYMVHFTGEPNSQGCEADFIEGTVDRVRFRFLSDEAFSGEHGIGAFAEDDIRGGCRNKLYGSLTITNSQFQDLRIGAKWSLKGNAPVNLTNNEFTSVVTSLVAFDSNETTNISGNRFVANSDLGGTVHAISIFRAREDAPQKTQFTIHDNYFEYTDELDDGTRTFAVFSGGFQARATSITITDNHFVFSGFDANAVTVWDVSNVLISNNTFEGENESAVWLAGETRDARDSVIVGNDFSNNESSFADIDLNEGTVRVFVGPRQGNPSVSDTGTDNIVSN